MSRAEIISAAGQLVSTTYGAGSNGSYAPVPGSTSGAVQPGSNPGASHLGSGGTSGTGGSGGGGGGAGSGGGGGSNNGGGGGAGTGGGGGGAGSGGIGGNIITASCPSYGGSTINLGSDGPFTETGTGGAAVPVESVLNMWANYVDSHGGICGRQVHMYVTDDGGSPSAAVANIEDMVQNKHVAALVSELTSATLTAQQPYEDSHQVPLIGGDVEQGAWNLDPVFFPQAASDPEQLIAFYKAAQKFPSGNKVAFLYCIEVAACAAAYNYQVSNHIPQVAGSQIVYSKQVSLTQISFAAECQAAKAAGAGTILTAGDASFTERIANSCGQQGITMAYMAPGAAASADMVQNQYLNNHTVTTTTVQPWMVTSTPGSALFNQLTSAYNVPRNGFSSLAFVSVLLAQQVLTLIGSGPVNTQTVLQTLRTKIHGFTAGGMTGPLNFGSGAQPQGTCTGLAEIVNGAWVGADNGALTCRQGTPLPLQNS